MSPRGNPGIRPEDAFLTTSIESNTSEDGTAERGRAGDRQLTDDRDERAEQNYKAESYTAEDRSMTVESVMDEDLADARRSADRTGGNDSDKPSVADIGDGAVRGPRTARTGGGLFSGALEFDSGDADDDPAVEAEDLVTPTDDDSGSGSDGRSSIADEILAGGLEESMLSGSARTDDGDVAAGVNVDVDDVADGVNRGDAEGGDRRDAGLIDRAGDTDDDADRDPDGEGSGSDPDGISIDAAIGEPLSGVRTRITSPRAGMFDLDSVGSVRSDAGRAAGTSGAQPSASRTAGSTSALGDEGDDDEELEWNYPVIIATAVAVVALIIVVLLVIL